MLVVRARFFLAEGPNAEFKWGIEPPFTVKISCDLEGVIITAAILIDRIQLRRKKNISKRVIHH